MKPRAHIAQMAPYALAEMTAPPGLPIRSLAQNESFRSPSPNAVEAARRALEQSMLYPDPDWTVLRGVLAEKFNIPRDGILCGNGSLDLIGSLARVYLGPDRAALAPEHSYPFFRSATLMANARFDAAPESKLSVCVDSLLEAVAVDTGMIFIANPGNPTGTRIRGSEIQRLRAGLPPGIILVVDEAYAEFSDVDDAVSFDLVAGGNTVVLRTFSKAYGLAGFRVGWGLFPPKIACELRKVLNPNNVSAVSQAAAIAAFADQEYMRETCDLTAAIRDRAATDLVAAGFSVLPSHANFLLLDLGTEEAAVSAERSLQECGIFLRRQSAAGLPQALRMTMGPRVIVEEAVALLRRWKEGQHS